MRLVLTMLTVALLALNCGSNSDEETVEDISVIDLKVQDSSAAETINPSEDMVASGDIDSPEDIASELLGFGATCVEDTDCDKGVCHTFGNGGPLCTISCAETSDCPEGSEGQKCNNKGVCKP